MNQQMIENKVELRRLDGFHLATDGYNIHLSQSAILQEINLTAQAWRMGLKDRYEDG